MEEIAPKKDIFWISTVPQLLCYKNSLNIPIVDEKFLSNIFLNAQAPQTAQLIIDELRQLPLHKLSLGRYFEKLIHFILKNAPDIEIILYNTAIQDEKKTLGEIDLLFYNKKSDVFKHWEVAFKYYLCTENALSLKDFVGPKKQDSLLRKLKHVSDKQLPLGSHKKILDSVQQISKKNSTILQSELLLLGMLFYAGFKEPKKFFRSNDLNPQHLHGWWLRENEISELKTAKETSHWVINDRRNWNQSCRFAFADENEPLSLDEFFKVVTSHFLISEQELLIQEVELISKTWVVKSRGFIVSNNW